RCSVDGTRGTAPSSPARARGRMTFDPPFLSPGPHPPSHTPWTTGAMPERDIVLADAGTPEAPHAGHASRPASSRSIRGAPVRDGGRVRLLSPPAALPVLQSRAVACARPARAQHRRLSSAHRATGGTPAAAGDRTFASSRLRGREPAHRASGKAWRG